MEIQEWQRAGDTLIIGGDWNADTTTMLWNKYWQDLDFIWTIQKGGYGPEATCNHGSLQVNAIYVLPNLQDLEFKVIPIMEGICGVDHKVLVLGIPKQVLAIGPSPLQWHKGWKLKIGNPQIWEKYNKVYKQECHDHNIFECIDMLWQQIQPKVPLNTTQQEEFEDIDNLWIQAMQKAEKNCCTLKLGGVEWSPQIGKSWDRIARWMAVVKTRTGKKVSSHLIWCLLGLQGITLAVAQQKLKEQMKNYYQLKHQTSQHRDTYLERLAAA